MAKKTDGNVKWIKRVKIRDGVSGEKKLKILSSILKYFFHHGKRDRQVRVFVLKLLHRYKIRPKDHIQEVEMIQKWIQKNIRYVFDPFDIEYFMTARRQLHDYKNKQSGSDCDDMSILAVSMLGSIGYHAYILLVDSKGTGIYSHAMAGVKMPRPYSPYGNRIIPIELTKSVPLGWHTEKATKCYVIDLEAKKPGYEKNIGYVGQNLY